MILIEIGCLNSCFRNINGDEDGEDWSYDR